MAIRIIGWIKPFRVNTRLVITWITSTLSPGAEGDTYSGNTPMPFEARLGHHGTQWLIAFVQFFVLLWDDLMRQQERIE
jgi:hypothetical protein